VGSKLAFRQVHGEDREELGQSMLFREREMQDIARLEPGEAFFFTEGYFGPQRIRTPNLGEQMRLTPSPSDEELLQCIREQRWFQEAARQRIGDELEQLQEAVDKFDDEQRSVTDQVQRLLKERHQLLHQPGNPHRAQRLTEIARALGAARKRVTSAHDAFLRGPYRRFRHAAEPLDSLEPPELRALGQSVHKRSEALIQSGTPGLLKVMDEQIRNLRVSH
jgi:hypothetical protein